MTEERHIKKARGRRREIRIMRSISDTESSSDDTSKPPDLWRSIPHSFKEIEATELIELDSRPTFVVDLHNNADGAKEGLNVVFCNKSLRFFDELRRVITAQNFYPTVDPSTLSSDTAGTTLYDSLAVEEAAFREWATQSTNFEGSDGYLPRHTFRGMYWTSCTLRERWRVISASQVPNQRPRSHGTPSRSSRSTSRSSFTSQQGKDAADLDFATQLLDIDKINEVLTQHNPVGMYYLSPDGNIAWANPMWYEITGHPRGLEGQMSFMNVISESDHPLITKEWDLLLNEKGTRTFELRLRNPWIDPATGVKKQKWILASCGQEWDEDTKELKSVMGCITDISLQKHAEENALELARVTRNFKQISELAPCGMFTFDLDGKITWANPQAYEMTGHGREDQDHFPMSILGSIEQEDHESFLTAWGTLVNAKEEISAELRLKKPWIRHDSNESVRDSSWILFLALPQLDGDGNITNVLGCLTDISHFKWAESVQTHSRIQAEEAKKNQETFIDMTSHEMRNPLSAILLCADGIADSLMEYQSVADKSSSLSQELIESNLDAAQTIVLCAQHQKRIIDDVLTLSKLNSAMLHVTPTQVQIESTVRRTLKMFETELQSAGIKMTFLLERSYEEAQIDWVLCDPVRFTQIFINLLTNAIKFTRSEERREIDICIGASTSKPGKGQCPGVEWFPSKDVKTVQDLTLRPEWGTGPPVYIYFAVRDTGRGLDEEEKTRLFHRFSQASPRTHVQYGGSGLGLFISRQLTELQGGEIGVASQAGVGSTFAFYIKTRKWSPLSANTTNPSTPIKHEGFVVSASPDFSKLVRVRYSYHILLVEDNLVNQKVLSKQLRNVGCTLHVANHGGEAIDFLSKTVLWSDTVNNNSLRMELSVILMDLEMPVMDGLACVRRIRDLEREGKLTRHIPIVAVTANTRMEQMEIALEAGMDDIVPKPFQIPELMQKISRLMSKLTL